MTTQALKRAVVENPDDAEARFELAEALFGEGLFSESEKHLKKALSVHPAHANAQRLLARVHEAQGRSQEASADLGTASYRERAKRFEANRRLDDAIVYGTLAAKEATTDAALWMDVAQWCVHKRLFHRARLAFGRALEISQHQPSQVEARDALLRELGEDDSVDVLSEARGSVRDAVEAIVLGDPAAAKRALATAGDDEKRDPLFELLRGELKLAEGDRAGATACFTRARGRDASLKYAEGRLAKLITFNVPGRIGVLGWTPVGGAVSPLEAVAVPGHGTLQFTGNVGETGREAGLVAFTCLKALSDTLGIEGLILGFDLHLHFTDTEMGKEGTSSGLALTLAGLSAYRKRPLRPRLGATGTITLHGEVQRVEGIYEKFVASKLAGLRRLLYPRGNSRDVKELPALVTDGLELIPVSSLDEAMPHAFVA